MPGKKREVQTFATRLSPDLVRKLDAYAEIANLSRNQVIEKMLREYWKLRYEAQQFRDMISEQNRGYQPQHEALEESEDRFECQQLRTAERLANPKFFDEANNAAAKSRSKSKSGKR